MADIKCPNCGLWNTGSAQRCDCAYDFTANTVKESFSDSPPPSKEERREKGKKDMLIGALWFVGGLLVTGISYAGAGKGGTYVIITGAILYGIARIVRGVVEYNKSQLN